MIEIIMSVNDYGFLGSFQTPEAVNRSYFYYRLYTFAINFINPSIRENKLCIQHV